MTQSELDDIRAERAYRAGYEVGRGRGSVKSQCNYAIGSRTHKAWLLGYQDGLAA